MHLSDPQISLTLRGSIGRKNASNFERIFSKIPQRCFISNKKAQLSKKNSGNICRTLEIALAYVRRARKKMLQHEPRAATFRFGPAENERSAVEKCFDDLGGFDDLAMHTVRAIIGTRTATPGRSCATRASATRAASRSSSPSPGGPSRGASSRRIIRSTSTTSASSPTRGRRREGS